MSSVKPIPEEALEWFNRAPPLCSQLPRHLGEDIIMSSFEANCFDCERELEQKNLRLVFRADGGDQLLLGVAYCSGCKMYFQCGFRIVVEDRAFTIQPEHAWTMPWEQKSSSVPLLDAIVNAFRSRDKKT